ncbi:GDP-mannose 4,6-dehydratase [Kozakia baliensis]|uniref:GDP-mannose 4,6-dehydratase n=1 Tax=Kozakia baliensis TaxID=153496 RepID=UPI000497BBF5|nr:GDP-mannose 4,6-dehydratase [Kozakia baliensis]
MRVLITGSSGFVGQHLTTRLLARFPDAELLPSIGDITDRAQIEETIKRFKPDHCLHLAAISTIGAARSDPKRAWQVNLEGTLILAEAMQHHAPEGMFLFASTAEVYGKSFQAGTPLDEKGLLAPANAYALTKSAADLALGMLAMQGLRAVRMRPFNHTGPGQSADFVVPAFARQIARIGAGQQEPCLRVGNLDAVRDFLDVRDVCDAYLDVIASASQIEPGAIFNLCSGQSRSIRSILDQLLEISGIEAKIEIDPARLRPSDIPMALGNADAAKASLNWRPRIDWETTLQDVMTDWRQRIAENPEV